MDEKSRRISRLQYQKLFQNSNTSRSDLPLLANKEERFLKIFSTITFNLINLQLGVREFDSITLDPADTTQFTPEDYIEALTHKFTKLVEVYQAVLAESSKAEEETAKLKDELTRKIKETEQNYNKYKAELDSYYEKNQQLLKLQEKKKLEAQKAMEEMRNKDDTILELNKNIGKLMDDFLAARERNAQIEKKLKSYGDQIMQIKQLINSAENKKASNEEVLAERERELEVLQRQHQVVLLKHKQNEKKVNSYNNEASKKEAENEKNLSEYSKLLEKNNNHVKRIEEIQNLKEELKGEIEKKAQELEQVRQLNQEYEEAASKIALYEKELRQKEEEHYLVVVENETLKQQIAEISPHSIVNDGEYDEEIIQELYSQQDLEKYADMSTEEIHAELMRAREIAYKNYEHINKLEAENNRKIEQINMQKRTIQHFQEEYAEKLETYNQVKAETEEEIVRHQDLEVEVNALIQKFNALSNLLGEQEFGFQTEDNEIENQIDYKFSFNAKDEGVPRPLQLSVTPSKNDLHETPTPSTHKKKPSSSSIKKN